MEGKVIKHFTCKETNEVYNDGDKYETIDKERLNYLADRGYLIKEVTKKPVSGKK